VASPQPQCGLATDLHLHNSIREWSSAVPFGEDVNADADAASVCSIATETATGSATDQVQDLSHLTHAHAV
jgi:hypothetical protein